MTLLGLEDSCHNDYQCFLFEGKKSEESPDIAEFIQRWISKQRKGSSFPPVKGDDYHVHISHIMPIHNAGTYDVNKPHLYL